MSGQEGGGDGGVGRDFGFGQVVDRGVEVGDGDFGPRRSDQGREDDGQVLEGFVLDRFPVDSGMEVGFVGGYGHAGVDDPAHSERQTWDMIVEPVAVGEEDKVHGANQVVVGLYRLAESPRPGFFVAFDEKRHVARQRAVLDEVGNRIDGGENWAFVVRHAAAIEEAVEWVQAEWVGVPGLGGVGGVLGVELGVDDIVVPVKENGSG